MHAKARYVPWKNGVPRTGMHAEAITEARAGEVRIVDQYGHAQIVGAESLRDALRIRHEQKAVLFTSPDVAGNLAPLLTLWTTVRNRKGSRILFAGPRDSGLPDVHVILQLVGVRKPETDIFAFFDWLWETCSLEPDSPDEIARRLWRVMWATFAPDGFTPFLVRESGPYCSGLSSEHQLRQYSGHEDSKSGGLTLGGRDEAKPGYYRNAWYLDISGAFPAAMGREPYPLQLCKVQRDPRPDEQGMSWAVVEIPPMGWGPLPGRSSMHYPTGARLEGMFTNRELALAEERNALVRRKQVWIGDDYRDVFGAWCRRYAAGRAALKGKPGNAMLKHVYTRTWGMLARPWAGAIPHADMLPWAIETAARVRSQVFAQVLMRPEVGPVSIDNDGAIATGIGLPEPWSNGLGSWTHRTDIHGQPWPSRTDVRILKAGAFSFLIEPAKPWRMIGPIEFEPIPAVWGYSMEQSEGNRMADFEREWSEKQ